MNKELTIGILYLLMASIILFKFGLNLINISWKTYNILCATIYILIGMTYILL